MTEKFKNEQFVMLHSFGDEKVGFGHICGISSDKIYPDFTIYIVRMDPEYNPWVDEMDGYSCFSVPSSCLLKV